MLVQCRNFSQKTKYFSFGNGKKLFGSFVHLGLFHISHEHLITWDGLILVLCRPWKSWRKNLGRSLWRKHSRNISWMTKNRQRKKKEFLNLTASRKTLRIFWKRQYWNFFGNVDDDDHHHVDDTRAAAADDDDDDEQEYFEFSNNNQSAGR